MQVTGDQIHRNIRRICQSQNSEDDLKTSILMAFQSLKWPKAPWGGHP